ncbi:Ninjurin-1 Nerve injury-induced protein 1 [Collichthys lucidus]|uniref:Ninjurin-1 Nerve injury-induced protein 1 n=1 Tax=Collichthys lucidus TaxID=240159 RepID=A0A4U5URP9_COLLU|nr:Ninjurin-1 Nerve injury-induced protein 1 [Collichthys lucidus]
MDDTDEISSDNQELQKEMLPVNTTVKHANVFPIQLARIHAPGNDWRDRPITQHAGTAGTATHTAAVLSNSKRHFAAQFLQSCSLQLEVQCSAYAHGKMMNMISSNRGTSAELQGCVVRKREVFSVEEETASTADYVVFAESRLCEHAGFGLDMTESSVVVLGCEASDPDVWGRSQAQALNMNHYANKKSAAESMLDVALLMANASQLKAVLEHGPDFSFYTPIVTLISISLCLQVTVGVLLIFIGKKINRAQAFWVNPEVSKLSSKPHNLQMSFCVLYPQHNSPMSSPLTNSPIASYWTLAVTTATSPDTRSKFTRF